MDIAALKARANSFEGLTLSKEEGQEFLTLCKGKLKYVCCSTKKQLMAGIKALEGELKNTNNTTQVRIPPANYPTMLNVASMGKK